MDHERAHRYVEQLEAHMDEGGTTAPNNLRDLIKMVRELVSDKVILSADLFNERKTHITTCGRCQKPIEREYDVFRCTDCRLAMHRDCARAHFAESSRP